MEQKILITMAFDNGFIDGGLAMVYSLKKNFKVDYVKSPLSMVRSTSETRRRPSGVSRSSIGVFPSSARTELCNHASAAASDSHTFRARRSTRAVSRFPKVFTIKNQPQCRSLDRIVSSDARTSAQLTTGCRRRCP